MQKYLLALLFFAIALFVIWQWQPEDPLIGPDPIDTYFDSPEYGVHTSFWWRPEIVWRDLDMVNEMGFGWAKQAVAWRDIENITKGEYDWYRLDEVIVPAFEERNIKLLVRLDRQPLWSQADPSIPIENSPPANYADFFDFCGTIAARYKGRIQAYQVWNEPNLDREWGGQAPDPVQYTELLKGCYEAIKSADSDAIVISAGLAPTATNSPQVMPDSDFLRGMYEAGAADYFDVLGLNAPGYAAPPDISPEDAIEQGYTENREFAFRHVEDMRRIMLEYGDGATQVAILEMGWITSDPGHYEVDQTLEELHYTYNWFAVDPDTQAENLVGAYEFARENWAPWIGLMTTIYMSDFDWNAVDHEQWWWSITFPDGQPRPAYNALKEMEK